MGRNAQLINFLGASCIDGLFQKSRSFLLASCPRKSRHLLLYSSQSNGYALQPKNASNNDIDLRMLSQSLRKFQMPLSWLHFKKVYENGLSQNVSNEQLADLLRLCKFPNWYKASEYTIRNRMLLILEIMNSRGCVLEEGVLRHLVANFAAMLRLSDARFYWDKLTALYPVPSIDSFSAFAFLHLQEKNPEGVLKVLEQIKFLGLQPNQSLRFHVLRAYGELNQVDKIMETFQDISDNNPEKVPLKNDDSVVVNHVSSRSYLKLFKALSSCDITNNFVFEQLLDIMIQSRISPKEEHFYPIMDLFCRTGLPSEAVKWFSKMRSFGIHPDMKNCLDLLYLYKRTLFPELFIPLLTDPEFEELRRIMTVVRVKKKEVNPALSQINTPQNSLGENENLETSIPVRLTFFLDRIDDIRISSKPEVKERKKRRSKQYLSLDFGYNV